MSKWVLMMTLMLGIGYVIAADTEPPAEEVIIENVEPDQAIEPPQEEPVISEDIHPDPVVEGVPVVQ